MKQLYIIKLGSTFPATKKQFGDFDRWTREALGPLDVGVSVVDVLQGVSLPAEKECAGVVVMGSHAMVTDRFPWSVALEGWLKRLLTVGTPLFGICYGHQLLVRAAGGQVDFHPRGPHFGTVDVNLLPACATDPLFQSFPQSFRVHISHSQSVVNIPQRATRLAAAAHDPNHAVRLGDCAWGVQFHPEYRAEIVRSYIQQQRKELMSVGQDVSRLLNEVSETPIATRILREFGRFVEWRLADTAV